MTGGDPFLTGTQPDAIGAVGAEPSYRLVLEISPPDYVEKISRYLASSVGQGTRDEVAKGPAEAESDSGESLFITQKEATLPEAARSAQLRRYSSRSKPPSPRDLEEGEGDSSSTSQNGELKTPKSRRRKKHTQPKYSFPFLKKRECKLRSTLLPDHNQSINDYTIGGFFKCLGELRQSSQRGQNPESSLPTVDMDGEDISPLSEEDGARSEDEDIKVVERKHFLASSKKTSQQTWCNQLKRQMRRKDNNAGRETSGGRETKILHIQQNKKSLDPESSGRGGAASRVLAQRTREASKPVAGQAGDRPGSQLLLHGLPDHSSVTKVKKRTEEWSKGLHAAASVNVEVEETPSLSEGYRAAQTSAVLRLNGTNATGDSSGNDNTLRRVEGDIPDSKQRKKSAAGSLGQEVDGNLECDVRVEDSVSSVSCDVEDGGGEDVEQLQCGAVAEPQSDDAEIQKKKKSSGKDVEQLQSSTVAEPLSDDAEIQKKKKRKKGSGEEAEQLQSSTVAEPLSDDAEIKKKKKRKKGIREEAEQLQSGAVAEPLRDDAEIQKKRRRKGSCEDVEQLQSSAVAEPPSDDAVIKKKKKKKKRRKGSVEDAEQLQSAAVAEPLSDDAEIKKKKKKKKKRKKGSGEDAEQLQSSAVAEPPSDDAVIKKKKKKRRKGNGEEAEQLQSAAVAEPLSDDAELQKEEKKKKKKKKKKRKGGGEDAEQLQSSAVAEPPSDDAEIKKKKKKRKGRGDEAEQLQSSAVAEPLSDDAEIQKEEKKKKKKKRRKGGGEDAEQLQSSAVAEPLSDDAEIQKEEKKKKKKGLGIVITEENEEEEASTRTLDSPSVSTEQLEASGNCLENAAASQEPLGSSLFKRKRRQKKQQSFSNDATQDGEEGVDVSFCLDDSVTLAKGSRASLKKKRKTISEGMNVSYTLKEMGKFKNVSNQKTNEGLEEQNAELVTKKKKKKKKREIFSTGVSEDKVVQSDDSVSAQEKEKKRHSSFLIADAEESDAQTHREHISPSPSRVGDGDVEELNGEVTKRKKKKRKSKTSVTQDSAGDLPESAGAGRKRKKERTGSESEGLDSAADAGFSANDEAVVLKKKKKKKCNDVIVEGPPTATTCSSVSSKKKGKCDASAETLTSVEPDLASSETLNDTRDPKKKKKKLKNEGKSLTESAESEPRETKKKQKKDRSEQPPVLPQTPDILRKKDRKFKRKLLNPNEEFFTDF